MRIIKLVFLLCLSLPALVVFHNATASTLSVCADQFIDGDESNAPTMYSSAPDVPYKKNKHQCYKADGHSLFALEYWPKNHTPRWVAYKLSDNYGTNGCATRPRAEMQCYFKKQTWDKVEECIDIFRDIKKRKAKDPFHEDPFLVDDNVERLKTNAFENTGHDRGHMAPNNAFSWNLCATYHTFSMANMSAQQAHLNRQQWKHLEAQVLYWGAETGPVYVVTGPIFNKFPSSKFNIFKNDIMDKEAIYSKNTPLIDFNTNDNPKNPDIHVPTGYYKVIFRPEIGSEPAHAIGFLLPHTNEKIENFWDFTSRIDVIEKASGVRFTGIPENMKKIWSSGFFYNNKVGGWKLRVNCNQNYTAGGLVDDSTHDQRLDKCSLQ